MMKAIRTKPEKSRNKIDCESTPVAYFVNPVALFSNTVKRPIGIPVVYQMTTK